MVISVVLLVGCRVGLFRGRLVQSRFFLLGWRRQVLVGLAVEVGHTSYNFISVQEGQREACGALR